MAIRKNKVYESVLISENGHMYDYDRFGYKEPKALSVADLDVNRLKLQELKDLFEKPSNARFLCDYFGSSRCLLLDENIPFMKSYLDKYDEKRDCFELVDRSDNREKYDLINIGTLLPLMEKRFEQLNRQFEVLKEPLRQGISLKGVEGRPILNIDQKCFGWDESNVKPLAALSVILFDQEDVMSAFSCSTMLGCSDVISKDFFDASFLLAFSTIAPECIENIVNKVLKENNAIASKVVTPKVKGVSM